MLTKYSQFMILDSKLICSRERERGGGTNRPMYSFVLLYFGWGGYWRGFYELIQMTPQQKYGVYEVYKIVKNV